MLLNISIVLFFICFITVPVTAFYEIKISNTILEKYGIHYKIYSSRWKTIDLKKILLASNNDLKVDFTVKNKIKFYNFLVVLRNISLIASVTLFFSNII